MHSGNLSFFTAGERVTALAPVYDMLPTRYSGQGGEPVDGPLSFAPPVPADGHVWDTASAAAIRFWRAVAARRSVSPQFARIAAANTEAVVAWRRLGELLPSPSPAAPRRRGRARNVAVP